MKNILENKHVQSVSVLVLQNADTKEIAGKIISAYSDSGICKTQAFIRSGKLANPEHSLIAQCSGGGYNKLHSNLMSMFHPVFNDYQAVKDLDAGLLHKWFNSHGYILTEVV